MVKWIVWKLPSSIVYWCAIRIMAFATQGRWANEEVPALLAMTALERWEKGT